MKYEFLLFDVDDTILDFKACEYPALVDAMNQNEMILTEEGYEVYKLINKELWMNFEEGVYTKEEILTLRFDLLFFQLGMFGDAAQVSHDFLKAMGKHITYEPGAKELLVALKGKATLAVVTNGAELSQQGKLDGTGAGAYFDYVFVSDDKGFHKPQKEFFDVVAAEVEGFDKNKALIIGDSLGSDIKGGLNFGIDSCWYNKFNKVATEDCRPTYEIKALKELIPLL